MDSSKMGKAWGKLGWKAIEQTFKTPEEKSEYFRAMAMVRYNGSAPPLAHKKCRRCAKSGLKWMVVNGKCTYKKNGKNKSKTKNS